MKVGAMAAPYFSAVGNGYIGRHGGALYRRFPDGLTSEISADTAYLDQLLEASSNERLWAITSDGRLYSFVPPR